MRIDRLVIRGVQSIADEVELDELGAMNILVGPNGAGKSAVLRALALTLGGDGQNRPHWVRRGEAEAVVSVTIRFATPNEAPPDRDWVVHAVGPSGQSLGLQNLPPVEQIFQAVGEPWTATWTWRLGRGPQPAAVTLASAAIGQWELDVQSGQTITMPGSTMTAPSAAFYRPMDAWWRTIIGQHLRWVYIPAFRAVPRREQPQLSSGTSAAGQGLASRLMHLMASDEPAERQRFGDIQRIFREVTGFNLWPASPGGTNEIQLTVAEGESPDAPRFPLVDSGSGLENFAAYLIHILEQGSPVVGLEEPESHLHPGAQRQLWQWLVNWATRDGPQFFITTHSAIPDALIAHPDTRIFVVTRPPARGTTIVVRRPPTSRPEWRVLGYGAGEWIGADGVVLVEGDSDADIVQAWLRRKTPDRWLRVLPVEGKPNAVAAAHAKAFAQLGIPYAVLVDESGDPRAATNPDEPPIFRLDRHEIENYLLVAEALAEALRTERDKVERCLQALYEKEGPRAWSEGFWQTLNLSLSTDERRRHTTKLAEAVAITDFPLGRERLEELAAQAVEWVLAERNEFKKRIVKLRIRQHLAAHSDAFWARWRDNPASVVRGKEVLRAVRKSLAPNLPDAVLIERLLGQCQIPVPEPLDRLMSYMKKQWESGKCNLERDSAASET